MLLGKMLGSSSAKNAPAAQVGYMKARIVSRLGEA